VLGNGAYIAQNSHEGHNAANGRVALVTKFGVTQAAFNGARRAGSAEGNYQKRGWRWLAGQSNSSRVSQVNQVYLVTFVIRPIIDQID